MRVDCIHSIEYISPIVKDDYGNDFWLSLVNYKMIEGQTMHPSSGYLVIARKQGGGDNFPSYAKEEEAFWKTKERDLLKIDNDDFYVEEFKERMHSLEWKPKSITGYQAASKDELNLVTRFYVVKKIKN